MNDSGNKTQSKDWTKYVGGDQIISSYELEERLEIQEKKKPSFQINSKIPGLDRAIKGFRGGELIVVSGPTGEGKTLLCQTLTEKFAQKEEFPLWFSFEMPPQSFLQSFPSIPYFYLPAQLTPYNWQWFLDRVEENRQKHDGKIIIIDHLHFLLHFFQNSSPSLEIGRLVRNLKTLAVRNNYVIFLIAHIGKIADGERATMKKIRDSSFIAQEADTVLMIQRLKDKSQQAVLTVDKARRTGVFGKNIDVHKVGGYLGELERNEPEN